MDSYYETDPALCEELIYYQCGVVGLDAAIGELVKELNARTYDDGTKLIDRTTLLLYSDHNAYYDKMSHRVKDLNPDDISRNIQQNGMSYKQLQGLFQTPQSGCI